MALELDRVREIAERVAASGGLEVVEVEFRGSWQGPDAARVFWISRERQAAIHWRE